MPLLSGSLAWWKPWPFLQNAVCKYSLWKRSFSSNSLLWSSLVMIPSSTRSNYSILDETECTLSKYLIKSKTFVCKAFLVFFFSNFCFNCDELVQQNVVIGLDILFPNFKPFITYQSWKLDRPTFMSIVNSFSFMPINCQIVTLAYLFEINLNSKT